MKHPKVKNSVDSDLIMINFIEKAMRKCTKVIKEKRKILEGKYKEFQRAENSYNTSIYELQEYTKKRDEFVQKLRDKRNASKESPII